MESGTHKFYYNLMENIDFKWESVFIWWWWWWWCWSWNYTPFSFSTNSERKKNPSNTIYIAYVSPCEYPLGKQFYQSCAFVHFLVFYIQRIIYTEWARIRWRYKIINYFVVNLLFILKECLFISIFSN